MSGHWRIFHDVDFKYLISFLWHTKQPFLKTCKFPSCQNNISFSQVYLFEADFPVFFQRWDLWSPSDLNVGIVWSWSPVFPKVGFRIYVGVSLNGGTPKTPQNDHFFVGKPMVVGYPHFRNPHVPRNTRGTRPPIEKPPTPPQVRCSRPAQPLDASS